MTRTRTFSSFGHRNFRLFFLGQLTSQIGFWLQVVAQSLLVLELTGDGVALGLLVGCQYLPMLLLSPWAGVLADRYDKRAVLIGINMFAMVPAVGMTIVAFTDSPSLAVIYVLATLRGVAGALESTLRRSFVGELVPIVDTHNAVSLYTALMTGSRTIGPALAGLLIHTVGYGWTFFADAASFVAVIAALMLMAPGALRRPPRSGSAKGQIRDGLRHVRHHDDLWLPLAMSAIIGTFAFNFQTVLPLLVTRALDGDDTGFTILFSVLSLGSLCGALISTRRTTVTLAQLTWSATAFGASEIALAAAPNLAVACLVGLSVGLFSTTFMTATTSLVQLRAEPSMRGRVIALQTMVMLGSIPIGSPILGWVSDQFGSRVSVLLGGVAAVAAGVYGMRVRRNGRPRRVGTDSPQSARIAARR